MFFQAGLSVVMHQGTVKGLVRLPMLVYAMGSGALRICPASVRESPKALDERRSDINKNRVRFLLDHWLPCFIHSHA